MAVILKSMYINLWCACVCVCVRACARKQVCVFLCMCASLCVCVMDMFSQMLIHGFHIEKLVLYTCMPSVSLCVNVHSSYKSLML